MVKSSRISQSYRRKPIKFPPEAMYVISLFAMITILALRVFRRRRRFSKRQIDEYVNWKKGKSEEILVSKIAKLQTRLECMKVKRKNAQVRQEQERLLAKAEALRDTRGREIYGDAWDKAEAGECAPLRDLFALSNEEVTVLQSQAMDALRRKKNIQVPPLDLEGTAELRQNITKVVPRKPPEDLPPINYYDTPGEAFVQNHISSDNEAPSFSNIESQTQAFVAIPIEAPIDASPRVAPEPPNPPSYDGIPEAKHGNTSPPINASPRVFPHDGGIIPQHLIPKDKPSSARNRPSPRVLPYPPPRDEFQIAPAKESRTNISSNNPGSVQQ